MSSSILNFHVLVFSSVSPGDNTIGHNGVLDDTTVGRDEGALQRSTQHGEIFNEP